MHLFGRIDEEKEQRERSRGCGAQGKWKGVDAREQGVQRECARVAMTAGSRVATEPFDGGECVIAFEPPNDAAKCRGEAAHVVVEWEIFVASV